VDAGKLIEAQPDTDFGIVMVWAGGAGMPEQRGRTYHRNRVASTFSEEIGAMLEGELSDPRIAPSYVTDVVLAPGGKSARVFVAVHGSEAEEASTLAGLMTARAFIRSQIRDRMGVRHVPELTFAIDRSERMTGRMDELLGRMRKREKSREKTAAAVGGLDPTHHDRDAVNGAQEQDGARER
jgi:ribosome-binding factor A